MQESVGPKYKGNTVKCTKGNQANIPELTAGRVAAKHLSTGEGLIETRRRFLLSLITTFLLRGKSRTSEVSRFETKL